MLNVTKLYLTLDRRYNMSVTLKDIAEKAGVSISTVSRIINNDQNKPASKETIEKVWAIVRELGYVPNYHAKKLKASTKLRPNLTKNIGCILASPKDTFKDHFFSQILMGIQSEAGFLGYNVGYTFSYFEDRSALFQHITSSEVDGFLLLGRINEDLFNFIKDKLGDKIKEVRLSQRLKSHPVCITSDGELSVEMEKILNAMPTDQKVKADKILEINPDHPILEKLKSLYESDKDKLAMYSDVLYNQALLIEGMSIEDPVDFSNKICELML